MVKFENGSHVMINGGNNIGRIGILQHIEKHPSSFDIAHVKDATGQMFATRVENIFMVGDGKTCKISLPKGKGIKKNTLEERDNKERRSSA